MVNHPKTRQHSAPFLNAKTANIKEHLSKLVNLMRVRWRFYFHYEDLKFQNAYTYGVQVSREQAEKFGLPLREFEAEVTVGPDEEKHGFIKQRGLIHITLPGTGEQTKDIAHSIAITFEPLPRINSGGDDEER